MKMGAKLIEATHVRRLNRFSCIVSLAGRDEAVYLPNSGRLKDILVPGRTVFLAEKAGINRRTKYDLALVSTGDILTSVDARVATSLVDEALKLGKLAPFRHYHEIRREVPFHSSRLDFLLSGDGGLCYVEVKSVTMACGDLALFPDAPTLRGRRHLQDLIGAREDGHEAAVVFIVQQGLTKRFSPNDELDPAFGVMVRRAYQRGVGVYCYGCRVSKDEIEIDKELEVYL